MRVAGRQTLRIRTHFTRWSASLRRMAVARPRVGRMLVARFGPLIVSQSVLGLGDRLARGQLGVAGEVGARVAEGGVAQRQEAGDVPVADVGRVGVDVDGEVEEVADREPGGAVGAGAGPAAAR